MRNHPPAAGQLGVRLCVDSFTGATGRVSRRKSGRNRRQCNCKPSGQQPAVAARNHPRRPGLELESAVQLFGRVRARQCVGRVVPSAQKATTDPERVTVGQQPLTG